MTHVDHFKLQSKNLFKDYKTQFFNKDSDVYDYKPTYFDVNQIVLDFEIDERSEFSLMKAQHIMAMIVGFKSWAELIKASEPEQELARLWFDNQHKISLDDWEDYVVGVESDNNTRLDPKSKLDLFRQVFANIDGHHNPFQDYRWNARKRNPEQIRPMDYPKSRVDITTPFTIKPDSEDIRAEIDKKLEAKSISKDTFLDCYRTSGMAHSSAEKWALGRQIKSDIISIVQRVANDRGIEITIERLIVEVDFDLRQVPSGHKVEIKDSDYAVVVGNYDPIIVRPIRGLMSKTSLK